MMSEYQSHIPSNQKQLYLDEYMWRKHTTHGIPNRHKIPTLFKALCKVMEEWNLKFNKN